MIGILTLARDPLDQAARVTLGRCLRSELYARVPSEIGACVHRDYAAAVATAVRVVANVKMPNRSDEYKDRWARNVRLAGEIAQAAGGLDAVLAQIETEQRGLREKIQDAVVLSTIHSAKGLEWDAVFVAGFEDGLMPHKLGTDTEEERRIAFVAMTRAKRYLAVTYATSRDGELAGPSPFLREAMTTLNGDKVDWRARATAPWIIAERKRAKAQGKRQRKRAKAGTREAGAATGNQEAESNKPSRASRDLPMVGSVQATRNQADWTDGELANLVRLYHGNAGEVLTLAQSVYRTPAEVAERILIGHYGITPAADECPEGRLFLEAADRGRLPAASQETHTRLMQALGAYLPANRVRAWLISPRAELDNLSPGAYVSRVRGGIQAILSMLEHAPAADAPGSERSPDATS